MTAEKKSPLHSQRLSGIEAARGIAAIMVVFYHAARHLKSDYGVLPWDGIARFGHAGVDFFFVLSGFIIFFVHARDFGFPSRLSTYFERRYIRIYPLFWVSLIVGLALTALSSKQIFPGIGVMLENATLLPYGRDIGVAWTLQHEILFYLIFAVLIIHRLSGIIVFSLWLSLIVASWLLGYTPASPILSTLASMFNLDFFFGMFSAYIVKSGIIKQKLLVFATGTTMFFGFALAENLGIFDGYAASAKIAYGLSAMLIVIGLAGANLNGFLKAPRFLTHLGKASYSIYLFHLACIGVIYKLLDVSGVQGFLPLDVIYFLLSAGAITVCVVISAVIEYPLMNLARSFNASLRKVFQSRNAPIQPVIPAGSTDSGRREEEQMVTPLHVGGEAAKEQNVVG